MANRKNSALLSLLENNSVADAAAASGISETTIFRYMRDPAFRAKFQKAKQDIVDSALTKLQRACAGAVDVLVQIMKDKSVPPGVRVRAADCILSRSMDTTKIEALELRISQLEEGKLK